VTYLLSWAAIGADMLVGLADPTDPARGMHIVRGRLEQDCEERTVLRFTLPCTGGVQTVDARRLGSTSAALHVTDTGEGWAVTVFPEGSEAHLRWLIREAQQGIRRLLGDRMLATPQASRQLAELAASLHSLMLRAAHLPRSAPRGLTSPASPRRWTAEAGWA
jgi:hypothetical protein